jgi:ArsR family transcriptional regulator, lead/cadmium/zinc/bismuth-responsive transcriptional repressor
LGARVDLALAALLVLLGLLSVRPSLARPGRKTLTLAGTSAASIEDDGPMRVGSPSAPKDWLAGGPQICDRDNIRTHVVMKPGPYAIPDLGGAQIAEISRILRLLGEPSRLRILLACLAEPASVGEIAQRVAIARSLVSHHLRLLRAARLLRADRNGKQIIYSPVDDRVACVVADLAAHVVDVPRAKGKI